MNIKREIALILEKILPVTLSEIMQTIELPPNEEMGDYAFPCFKLAKQFRKPPMAIACELSQKVTLSRFFSKVTSDGPYINFFLNKASFAQQVIGDILNDNIQYNQFAGEESKTVVIDYSSPNIAKPFHVGHLRSTVIGHALYNIYEKLGYTCIGINHLGDWGTQFGKLIVAYNMWGKRDKVETDGIIELNKLYVKFHEAAKDDDSLNDEARAWFVKMQNADSQALDLWKWFYDISLKEFNRIYDMLGVNFDYYTGESFYNDKMNPTVEELEQKQLLTESNGAMIVNLDNYNMPPCLIIRSDGGTLYATRDITAALYRKKEFKFSKCLYLTALDQNLHFAQFFKVLEIMGHNWAANELVHVPFGLVSLDSGKLSTRSGNVILMEHLLDEAISKTLQIINEKNPALQNKEQVAKDVGIGAVIFNDLYNTRIKDVVFSWERMLNFDGETGPYVQYTYVRAKSVLNKSNIQEINLDEINFNILSDEESFKICKLLYSFVDKIIDAAEKNEPSIITRYIVDLAQAFNKFYHENKILDTEDEIKKSRLAIVFCVERILKEGLNILGIKTPERM